MSSIRGTSIHARPWGHASNPMKHEQTNNNDYMARIKLGCDDVKESKKGRMLNIWATDGNAQKMGLNSVFAFVDGCRR